MRPRNSTENILSFILLDYAVSDQIKKKYLLTILLLAAPALNINQDF